MRFILQQTGTRSEKREYIVTKIVDVRRHSMPYDVEGKKLYKTLVIEYAK